MTGISLQISKEEGEKGISPELLAALMKDGWTIDNIETF